MSCSTRLNQNIERKQRTPRYCKKHKIHYFKECPNCSGEQKILGVD